MKSRKYAFSILITTLILLAAAIHSPRVPTLAQQMDAPGNPDLAATASAGGVVGGPFIIGDEAVDTVTPAVAYNIQRQEYLVVWWNDRAGCDDVFGRRVSKSGIPIGLRFPIAAGCSAERRYPDVAYNSQDDEYLVIWSEGDIDIYGQRVSATGGMTGTAFNIASGVPSYPRFYQPAIAYASTANQYLVVFQSYSPTTGYGIVAQALNSNGSASGTSFEVESLTTSLKFYPDLTYNFLRNEFLVVWAQYNPSQYDIRGRRVKMSGGAGTLGTAFWFSCDPSRDDFLPAVAAVPRSPSGQYLVVWEYWSSSSNYDIWAQRVDGDGTLEGTAFLVHASPQSDLRPAVAGSNSNQQYLVTWSTPPNPIFGRSIATNGPPLGPVTGIAGLIADYSAVASGPGGDTLIVYEEAITGGKDIWGVLWGNRLYLPLLLR